MKRIYLILSICFLSLKLFAQIPGINRQAPATTPPPALEFRDVSGIVKDKNDDPAPGAKVFLKSPLDSVYTLTNANGVFIFKQIRRASFYITVTGVGIDTTTKLYYNSDVAKQIVLDPFELKPPKAVELSGVTINGKPTIVYKTDTVEYKASDYKVREGDTLDELLKKMEGFENRGGQLFYNGQEIKGARLNGRDFLGGNVAQAITTLPAEIIEKAQVVDDYGEQAAKTGIKTTEPNKILNVTTKPDRSIGTIVQTDGRGGNDERYTGNVTLTHINANRQIGIVGRINNTQTGVSNGISGGGGAGTTLTANPSISYSDQWKKLRLTSSYNYNYSDNNSINKSFGERYSVGLDPSIRNTSFFTTESTINNVNKGHRANVRLNYDLDNFNNIQFEPTFNYSNGISSSRSTNDNINNFTNGFEHLGSNQTSTDNNTTTGFGANFIYQHIFKKPRRNFSVQFTANKNDVTANGRKFSTYSFYADETQNNKLRDDSVANLQTRRTSNTTTYNSSITYLEPLSSTSQLEFTARINRVLTDNVAKQDTILANGQLKELPRLSNIFNTAFTESRVIASYTYNGKRVNMSLGGTLLPTTLTGTRVNNNNNQTVAGSISNFRVIPVFRFAYIFSSSHRLNLTYSGANTLPDFTQIQPFTDRSDPIYLVTGNPNLKPAFTNSLTFSYNNYIANSKFNISVSVTASDYKNKIISNQLQRPELIDGTTRYRTIFENTFENLDGSKALSGNYSISKQLADRRYNLTLNGTVSYQYNLAKSNNFLYHTTVWNVNQRFSPRFTPTDNIEVNPYIAYDIQRGFSTSVGSNTTLRQTLSVAIEGRFFIAETWRLRYNASKNFVTGLGDLNTNPLVINAGIERQLAKKNNLYLTFDVFDILKQNNFVQQNITPTSVTNTLSNALSRYFMVGLRATFQKWGGRPKRNGEELKRKGDGSFIY